VKLDVVAAPEFTMPALHTWLAERLPRFMVPPHLERCAEFPKTPSERIEKHKLAARRVEATKSTSSRPPAPRRLEA
jgi:carnitine-CoA ligase